MPAAQVFASLIAEIAAESDGEKMLDRLAKAALEHTGSRNSMIARLDDDLGVLELRHGYGREWSSPRDEKRVRLEINTKEGIVAYVAATGKTVASGNVAEDSRYKNLFQTTKSEIAVPIKDSEGRIRAVLNVESDRLDAYGEEELLTCEAIASLCAMVMSHIELLTREEALIEIGSALDSAMTEDELVDRVIHVAGDLLRFQAVSVFLFDPRLDRYILRGSVGALKDQVGQVSYQRGEGCTGWVCATGLPICLSEPQKDPRWRGRHLEFPSEQIAAFLAVPVHSRGRCMGAIRVIRRVADNPYLDNRFTQSEQRILQTIADQVGTGLENIRSVESALRAERMIAWGELSAKSSHMIGNRVFALKGDVNELRHLLEEREPNVEEIRALQQSLDTNVTRIEEILQDFRDFLTATQVSLAPTDLNVVLQETAREVFPRRSKVDLVMELDQDLPHVSMDAKKLRRAIAELIENSMNYMTTAGRLRIASAVAPPEMLRKGKMNVEKRFVMIELEDTGPGVREEQKRRIFEPFFSSRVKGMGLGLSIVKGIVDAHGGTVFEAGEEGKGAKFVILLPAAERP